MDERYQVASRDTWDVGALYPNWEAWEKDRAVWDREWPELEALRKGWTESASSVRKLLECALQIDRNVTKIYTYAHLRHDEDVAEEVAKQAESRSKALLHKFRQATSWMEPETLSIKREVLNAAELAPYAFYLEKIVRMKPHTLSNEEEALLALAGRPLDAASQAFGAFNNADLKFKPVRTEKGEERELTHGKYLLYLKDTDRTLRERAFKHLHQGFADYENLLCELLSGQVQRHLFEAKARKFGSCLEAALFPHQVSTGVYHALIKAVRAQLPALHRYMQLRKQILGVQELHLYDLQVPLFPPVQKEMGYEEAAKLVVEALAPLGTGYQETLRKGLLTQRWVDRYENARKRSGAYSSGCYDSFPYILMNYHGSFNDMMTLAHEAGHSMHSHFSHKGQPYHYSHYSIFVAEVASTFNEELVLRHLLKRAESAGERAFLINQQIDALRSTLIRQTLFAEFELKIHTLAEQGTPLTPTLLKAEYRQLNAEYYGPEVTLDPEVDIEWARIPHFYYNFYVYQYATGISAAQALAQQVCEGGAVERYLKFLSSGCSEYPVQLLQQTGVDLTSIAPVDTAMRHFSSLVEALRAC